MQYIANTGAASFLVASVTNGFFLSDMKRWTSVCITALALSACRESRQTNAAAPPPQPPEQKTAQLSRTSADAIAACTLVTAQEVGAIQGATITDTKDSAGPSAQLILSQCYYSAKEPDKSVSIAVIQPSAKSVTGRETREYWASTFGRFAEGSPAISEGKKEKDQKLGETRDEDEKRVPPKKIGGVGEEAYWSGNRFGGALYVLKNNFIFRVSVGGPDDEPTKIEKSKQIASKAVAHF